MTALFLGTAVVCAAFALSLWDVGARSPAGALRAAAATLAARSGLIGGILRFAAGLGYAVLAVVLVRLAIPPDALDLFPAFAIGALIVGLAVEALVGAQFRRLVGIRQPDTEGSGHRR